MKKVNIQSWAYLLIAFSGCLIASCDEKTEEITKPNNLKEFYTVSKEANRDFFGSIKLEGSLTSDITDGVMNYDNRLIKEQFHVVYENHGLSFDKQILSSLNFNHTNARINSDIIEEVRAINNHFGEYFYEYMSNINEEVFANADQLERINIEGHLDEIENSSNLSQDEKVLLISYLGSLSGSLDFIQNGGIQQIESQFEEVGYTNGRTNGCSVNVRNVLLSGVYGLATNAVRGAIIGGTAGTFSVPVLGTATGIVGGAVFGAAAGFVGGVIGGVVVELAATCTRTSGYEQAACKKTMALYHAGLINGFPRCGLDYNDLVVGRSRTMGNFFSLNMALLN